MGGECTTTSGLAVGLGAGDLGIGASALLGGGGGSSGSGGSVRSSLNRSAANLALVELSSVAAGAGIGDGCSGGCPTKGALEVA